MRKSSRREVRRSSGRRSTPESGLALAAAWRASGQTVAAFARAQGVPAHRVHYWKRREETAAAPSAGGEFLALEVASIAASERPTPIEVCVGEISVRFALDVGRKTFIEAVRWAQEAVAR